MAAGERQLGELLREPASDLGEHIVGVGANQPDRTDNNHENDRQHDRVFRDVLAVLFTPKSLNYSRH